MIRLRQWFLGRRAFKQIFTTKAYARNYSVTWPIDRQSDSWNQVRRQRHDGGLTGVRRPIRCSEGRSAVHSGWWQESGAVVGECTAAAVHSGGWQESGAVVGECTAAAVQWPRHGRLHRVVVTADALQIVVRHHKRFERRTDTGFGAENDGFDSEFGRWLWRRVVCGRRGRSDGGRLTAQNAHIRRTRPLARLLLPLLLTLLLVLLLLLLLLPLLLVLLLLLLLLLLDRCLLLELLLLSRRVQPLGERRELRTLRARGLRAP